MKKVFGIFLTVLVLTVFGGFGAGILPISPEPEQTVYLPFKEFSGDDVIRQYSFESAGLTDVLGCDGGYVLEVLIPGNQILRWFFDTNGRPLADSAGYPHCGEDFLLPDGTLVSNSCWGDGARRANVFRRSDDGGIEYGTYDLDRLIEDTCIVFRSINEQFIPDSGSYIVSYLRLPEAPVRQEDSPAEAAWIELEDLTELEYKSYAPSIEDTYRIIESALLGREDGSVFQLSAGAHAFPFAAHGTGQGAALAGLFCRCTGIINGRKSL